MTVFRGAREEGVPSDVTPATWITEIVQAQHRIREAAVHPSLLLDELVSSVSGLVDAPTRALLLEGGALVCRAASGDVRGCVGHALPAEGPFSVEVLAGGVPRRVGDLLDEPPQTRGLFCCGTGRSALFVPMVRAGRPLGALLLSAEEPGWFGSQDEETVVALAGTAASAFRPAPGATTPAGTAHLVTAVSASPAGGPASVRTPPAGLGLAGSVPGGAVPAGADVAGAAAQGRAGADVSRAVQRVEHPPVVLDPDGQRTVHRRVTGLTGALASDLPVAVLCLDGLNLVQPPPRLLAPSPAPVAPAPSPAPVAPAPSPAPVAPAPSPAPVRAAAVTTSADVLAVRPPVPGPDPHEGSAPPGTGAVVLPTGSLPTGMPDRSGLGVWQWDAAGAEVTWSESVGEVLGVPGTRLADPAGILSLVHPDDVPRLREAVARTLAGEGTAGSLRIVRPGHPVRHVHVWSDVRRADDGTVIGAWGGLVDVTARRQDAAVLRSSLAGLRAAQELTGLGIWEWQPDTGSVAWSPEMFRLLGMGSEDVEPSLETWHGHVHPEDRERARRLDLLAPETDGGAVETFRVVGADGVERHVQAWSTVVAADGDSPRAVCGAAVDVTRQVLDRTLLERLSATDAVTGLANRLGFDRRMQELLSDCTRDVAVLLLDLDRFKLINDSLGHQVGDRLLVEVARRLKEVVPDGSITARMGGDEFVVVPRPGLGWLQVRRLAQAIVDALRVPYVLPDSGEMLVCPASVGVTSTSGREVGVSELFREADLALYRAKDSGRDRYVVFDDILRARAQSRHRAERQLRQALDERRLALQYQPIVDFNNGRIVGAEALVRLKDGDGDRLLGPDEFIDVAEDTGLVVEVDCWVIDTAIAQIARWGEMVSAGERGPWLAINVSPRSMEHPRVTRRILDAVKQGRVPRHRIKVELTEHSFLGALPGGESSLRQLLGSGIPVGIDDFGTGYSALAYLQRFELDFMKIDKSFVEAVGRDERADAVVTAIVDLAHAHGMLVTAEGVETPRQARRLREIGCDFAQGFHFGRPGEAARILRG